MRKTQLIMLMAVTVLLTACGGSGNRQPSLLNTKSDGKGPDEFAIVPNKLLEIPSNLDRSKLPAPTPGASNRVDQTPLKDATRALGGNPDIRTADGGLVKYTSRYGVKPGIRQELAKEDLEYRRKNDGRLLERVFKVNVYYKAYRKQSLDEYAELERLRWAGIKTPSAPPREVEQKNK